MTVIRDANGRFVRKDKINLKVDAPVRDADGRFVKTTRINVKETLTGPDGTIINPEFEKPLVSVNVNNPFKKILYWLDQIRRHQTTTFAFKLSIPLIAIPIIIAALFAYSRFQIAGMNKVQPTPTTAPTPTTPLSTTLSRAGTIRIAVGSQTTYLLALRNGTLVVLNAKSIDLSKFKDKQVLVTGRIDSTTGIFIVSDIAEVQSLKPPPTPEATSSAK